MTRAERVAMIDRGRADLSVRRQCALVGLARSGVYRQPAAPDPEERVPAASGLGLQDSGSRVGGRSEPCGFAAALGRYAGTSPTTPQGQQQQNVVHI
jgi:hypothetical protein